MKAMKAMRAKGGNPKGRRAATGTAPGRRAATGAAPGKISPMRKTSKGPDPTAPPATGATGAASPTQSPETVAATGAASPTQSPKDGNRPPKTRKQPLAPPRGPLRLEDVVDVDEGASDPQVGDSGSDSESGESVRVCNICRHRKKKGKVSTTTIKDKDYTTCKLCKRARAKIMVQTTHDEAWKEAWEGMAGKNQFIAKCHHAMGSQVAALLDKYVTDTNARSVMDERAEGGRLLNSPEVEEKYKAFGEPRAAELAALHKANAFAERSTITGINKYYPDTTEKVRTCTRKRTIECVQTVSRRDKVKPVRVPALAGAKRSKAQPAIGGKAEWSLAQRKRIGRHADDVDGLLRQKECLTDKKAQSDDYHVPAPLWEQYENETEHLATLQADLALWLDADFSPTAQHKEQLKTLGPRIKEYEKVHSKVDNFLSCYDELSEVIKLREPIIAPPSRTGFGDLSEDTTPPGSARTRTAPSSGAGSGRALATAATGAEASA